MADNYLESRFEEVFGADKKPKVVVKRNNPSIDTLLHRNRSYRGYDNSHVVTEEELREIVGVNTLIGSGMNRQALRFRLVTKDTGADKVLPLIKLGGALPELHLPEPGKEPEAFIIVCSTVPEDNIICIDLGISLQSMLLKAVSKGLNGVIIKAFNSDRLAEEFSLQYRPLAVLAIGKGAESIFLRPVSEGESLKYYRKDGVHYVPKLKLEDILL
ncbi:MAG: nitroreductase family protein [Candidatus Cryptobacteroides sp.]|nr:nitroreductase family protein [Candidatus Cryptobacteroides sp.]